MSIVIDKNDLNSSLESRTENKTSLSRQQQNCILFLEAKKITLNKFPFSDLQNKKMVKSNVDIIMMDDNIIE